MEHAAHADTTTAPTTSSRMEHAAHADTTTAPTNNNSTAGQSCDEHRIDIDPEIWKASKGKELPQGIPKVPATLTKIKLNSLQWIKPSVVSIGPYYFRDDSLEKLQLQKLQHAKKFIEESRQNRDELYRKIRKKTSKLRKCYDDQEISKYKDNQLATIFLLDGCFLLRFIYHSSAEDPCTKLGFTNHEMAHIKQDLFLLENQLPYQVLQLLFEKAKFTNEEDGENPKKSMQDRIKDFVASQVPFPQKISVEEGKKDPCHLLHYLQGVVLNEPGTGQKQDKEDKEPGRRKWYSCNVHEPRKGGKEWHLCTVQALRNVGIHFKPSPTSYLTDISFNSLFCTSGCLKLPPIVMNTSTMIIFLNLIAFESSNTTKNLGVISYLCFLDSLIDRWNDVKVLQVAGILHNFVGEERDVAQFFNHVCSKLTPNASAYKDVMLQIESHVERHNNTGWRESYIQFKQKYFSSPWSFIALIGAVIGLSLTAVQTYTSLFPK